MKNPIEIENIVKIGDYKEVDNIELSTITKNDKDTQKISGLILRGYETKFGATNANGERYTKESLDDFINDYFIKHDFNMPVDIQHDNRLEYLCGRVLVLEVNSVGFYFVVYIPKTYEYYDALKQRIQEGIIQGFSKYGWATDYDFVYKKDGTFDYLNIKKFMLTAVSLVATPANRVKFEKAQETKNALTYVNKNKPANRLQQMFNK